MVTLRLSLSDCLPSEPRPSLHSTIIVFFLTQLFTELNLDKTLDTHRRYLCYRFTKTPRLVSPFLGSLKILRAAPSHSTKPTNRCFCVMLHLAQPLDQEAQLRIVRHDPLNAEIHSNTWRCLTQAEVVVHNPDTATRIPWGAFSHPCCWVHWYALY